MKRTVLGHLVGVGLALAAGTAAAQDVPGVTQGAPATSSPGSSVPIPGNVVTTQPSNVPQVGTQGPTPETQIQAAEEATQPTQQQAEVSAPEGKPPPQRTPLTLAELVARARRTDARVEEAEAELRRLQALQHQAQVAWFPKFDTVVGFGGPLPEARNNGLGGPPTTQASLEGDWNFGQLGVMVRADVNALMPVYTFGKLEALAKAGDQGPIIGAALRERARNEAGFQAAQAFYGYQLARSGIAQIDDTAKRLEDAAQRVNELLENESQQVSKLDTYKVSFFRQMVAARRSEALQGRALALEAIRLLSGARPGEPLEIAAVDLPLEEEFKPPSLERALTLSEQHRPELVAIQAGITAREQEVLIRERAYYPDFALLGFARFSYTTNATPQRSPFAYDPYNDRTVGVALAARATFDIPMKNAQLDEARAELEKLRAQQRLIQSAIRLEVTKVHGELVTALDKARALTDAERQARRWSTAAYAAFDLGTSDTRELVDAFTALAQASADKAKSWYDVRVGIEALSRVTGLASARP